MRSNKNVHYLLHHRRKLVTEIFTLFMMLALIAGCNPVPQTKNGTDTNGMGEKPSTIQTKTGTDTSGTGEKPSKKLLLRIAKDSVDTSNRYK